MHFAEQRKAVASERVERQLSKRVTPENPHLLPVKLLESAPRPTLLHAEHPQPQPPAAAEPDNQKHVFFCASGRLSTHIRATIP